MKPAPIDERTSVPLAEQPADSTAPPPPSKPPAQAPARRAGRFERWLIRRLLRRVGSPPVTIRLWDGSRIEPEHGEARYEVVLTERRTLRRLLRDPMFQFSETYAEGKSEVHGDLVELLTTLSRSLTANKVWDLKSRWLGLGRRRRNTLSRSQNNVHHHYDIGNDFYRLWLDERMLYTCAYFGSPEMTLEEAQLAKMDHVCRKVWLRPGEEVVELGCGWGALALHMAREYGVRVRAYNLSQEQVRYARERAREQGLDGQVEFVQADWRAAEGPCDAVVSVGMLEHVGHANYELLGRTISKILRPDGRGLIHSIGRNAPRPFDRWIERRIFPGAYPPAIREFLEIFESSSLSVLDVENIRLHYAETCRQWLDRFESHVAKVREMFDEKFVRTWRMYLAGSTAAFLTGSLQLFQVVFAPGENNVVPQTREFVYGSDGPVLFGPDGWAASGDGAESDSVGRPGNGQTPRQPR